MNIPTPRLAPALLAALLLVSARPAHAATYAGNGNSGFGGDLGLGSLSVTDDGLGGLNFVFALNGTTNLDSGNAVVIYIDNGTGNGIGADTSGLTDTSNGAAQAISEFGGGTNRSILNFGGLMSPQYGISLTNNNALDYKLVNGGSLTFTDNADAGQTSVNGESYSISGTTWSLDLPSPDFGLNDFSGAVIKFLAIGISQTGYSSDEATVTLSSPSGQGYGETQTLSTVNTFTAAVPEGSTAGLLACGAGVLFLLRRPGRLGRA